MASSSDNNNKFKAIRVHKFGSEDELKLEEVENFKEFQDDEVIIKVEATGVNPVDTYIRKGTYARKPALPYTPGADCAGTVEKIGKNVTNVKIGDRVYVCGTLTGSYAQKAIAKSSNVWQLSKLSFAQGASINVPYATAYRALFVRGNLKAGENVFIHGASGGVGIASIQLAKSFGCRVFGTAGTEKGLKLIKDQGCVEVFNHREDGYVEKIKQSNPNGFNIVLEMLANVNLQSDLELVARKGRIGVIGNRGEITINPRFLMAKESHIFGVALSHTDAEQRVQIYSALQAHVISGVIQPIVAETRPLSQAPSAHKDIIEKSHYGKLILEPWK